MTELKTPETQRRASSRYREKMQEQGWKRLEVWVPGDERENIVAMIHKYIRDLETHDVQAS